MPKLPRVHPDRHYRAPSRVGVYVSQKTGLRPGTVEQLIRGSSPIRLRYEALVEAAVVLGDDRLLAYLTAGIDAIRARRPLASLDDAAVHRLSMPDMREDQTESAWRADRSGAALRNWLNDLRLQYAATGDLIRAAECELEMTP